VISWVYIVFRFISFLYNMHQITYRVLGLVLQIDILCVDVEVMRTTFYIENKRLSSRKRVELLFAVFIITQVTSMQSIMLKPLKVNK